MNIRKYLRVLAPPLLVQQYHRLRPQKTWEGVYNSFRELEINGEGFDGDIWTKIVERETRDIAEELSKGETIPSLLKGDSSLLPFLVVIISRMAKINNSIKILDFGGGAGVDYLYLKRAIPQLDNLEFHIVESEKVCQLGRRNFQINPQITFHTALPEHISNFDIIHIDSVLQYIEDYPSLLKSLCKYKPDYFLFVRLSAGDIPTYATKQVNVPGCCWAYQFVNIDEFVSTMNQLGYRLGFKSLGDEVCLQDNFPEEYRIGRTCNLLFVSDKTS